MSRAKPLAFALLVALTATATAPDAFAQKKKSTKKAKAPAVSAECSDFYTATNEAWLSSLQAPAGTAAITARPAMSAAR